MNTAIFNIYDTYHKNKKTVGIIMMLINVLLFIYYCSLLFADAGIWTAMYAAVNPFTTGAYILGAAVLIQYIMYDNWIIKVLLSAFYGIVILQSFVVMMGMTSIWEMCIYIPHLIVIILCGIVTRSKQNMSTGDAAAVQDEGAKDNGI